MVAALSTSVSRSSSSARSLVGKNGRRPKRRRLLIIIASVLTVFLITVVVMVKGSVSGTEFAPSHFQTREFAFYEIPFLHIQITPIQRKAVSDKLRQKLVAKGWISAPTNTMPDPWHLVNLSRGPTSTPAMASLLIDEMAISDSNFWSAWNKEYPQRAGVLWPRVQRLAKREMYLIIPEMMLFARSFPGSDDANALTAELDRWLIDQYVGLINDLRDDKRDMLADEFLEEALKDFPDSAKLIELKTSPSQADPPDGLKVR